MSDKGIAYIVIGLYNIALLALVGIVFYLTRSGWAFLLLFLLGSAREVEA
jgi:hypothetical protein